jgi:hypothetical protein
VRLPACMLSSLFRKVADMQKPSRAQVLDCGHHQCLACSHELCKLHHFRPALCPFCRCVIRGFSVNPSLARQ